MLHVEVALADEVQAVPETNSTAERMHFRLTLTSNNRLNLR